MDPVRQHKDAGPYELPRPLKAGDEVLLVELDKKAVVLSAPDAAGNVEVQAGIIRTRVPVKGLRLLSGSQPNGKKNPSSDQPKTRSVSGGRFGKSVTGVRSRAERDLHTEMDMRGMSTDEALLELDRFIDDAVLSGIEHITIIHGKGPGALRAAVQTQLDRTSVV